MEKHKIIKDSGKVIAEAFFCLYKPKGKKEDFINSIVDKIPRYKDIGYAGFNNKKGIKKTLQHSIFGFKQNLPWKKASKEDCMKQIDEAIKACSSMINDKIRVFVFPTVDSFVIKEMNGVSGYTSWRNVILIYIYPAKGYKQALKGAVGHELAHAISLNFNNRTTIGDSLVFEGIAEHFREYFIGGKKARWVKSVSKQKAKQIFKEIKPCLEKQDDKLYRDLFFGTGKYPLWAGYAVGYYLVESCLKKKGNLDWKNILKIPPDDIIINYGF